MSKGLFIIVVFAIIASSIDCKKFENKIPFKRGKDKDFPDFSEDDIRTGFVDSALIYPNAISGYQNCDRICSYERELICYYQLSLEEFENYNEQACRMCLTYQGSYECPGCIQTDGVKTRLLSINRQMPGPPINVCVNDLLIIDVYNAMNESTSIHWHGMDQYQSPYMDGMPFITQAEIPRGKIFRYKFVASNHGTNFYHSHSVWQRGQGINGRLVVRLPPKSNPHWFQYDLDLTAHCIIFSDWGYNLQRTPNTYLINGKGLSSDSQGGYLGASSVFDVRPNYRYRFRFIYNGVNNIPVKCFIEGHILILIAADGTEITPVPVGSIVMNTGERFDVVVVANQPIGNYWLKVCNPLNCSFSQVAVLRYEGAPIEYPTIAPDLSQPPDGLQVNSLSVGPGTPGTITVSELRGLNPVPWLTKVNWLTTYLEISVNLSTLSFEIDKISMVMPQLPLLVEKDNLDTGMFCNRNTLAQQGIDCSRTICKCPHVIYYELNSYIEIIFFSGAVHPAHLHGYLFYVVGMGVITSQTVTPELIIEMDRRGELPRNNYSPPLKDTVQVPKNGYAIIRFNGFNPGFWFLHCHIELHAMLGMSAVLQIGQPNQMKPLPKNYQPYPT